MDVFCNAVNNMMNNPLLPAHGKGVLVALRPVPGIRVEQALTLCRPNRTGDIMTIGGIGWCCFSHPVGLTIWIPR